MHRDVGDHLIKAIPTVAVPKSRHEREAQSKSGGSGTTQPMAGLPASQVPAATQSSRVGCSSGVKQASTTNNGTDESEEKEKTKAVYNCSCCGRGEVRVAVGSKCFEC